MPKNNKSLNQPSGNRSGKPVDFTEFISSRPGGTVDKVNGIVHDVKFCGLESANGRTYKPEALRRAVESGKYNDLKINLNHPKKKERNEARQVENRFGVTKNSRFVEGDGVRGDLHYNVAHPFGPAFGWWAENEPEGVGMSHVAGCYVARIKAKNGNQVVEDIGAVHSLDLVADGGTVIGLFESREDGTAGSKEEPDMKWNEITIEGIRENRPDLVSKVVTEDKDARSLQLVTEERDSLLKENAEFKAKEALGIRKDLIATLTSEAKLPDAAITDLFREQLINAETDENVVALVEDRKALWFTEKPKAKEQRMEEGSKTEPMNADEFASAVK